MTVEGKTDMLSKSELSNSGSTILQKRKPWEEVYSVAALGAVVARSGNPLS